MEFIQCVLEVKMFLNLFNHAVIFFLIKEPIRIFIPYQANRGCRELIVKASTDGGTWKTMKHESGSPPQVDLEVSSFIFSLIIYLVEKRCQVQTDRIHVFGKLYELFDASFKLRSTENT